MEKNNQNQSWITKKELIAPVISIVAFLVLLVGASYAYYSIQEADPTNLASIALVNATVPRSCSFVATSSGNCNITSGTSSDRYDSIISTTELINQSLIGQSIAQCQEYLNINMTGPVGCKCTYNLIIEPVGESFSPVDSTKKEYTAIVKSCVNSDCSTYINTEANVNTVENTNIKQETLTLTSSTTTIEKQYALAMTYYNVDSPLQANNAGKNYKYKLSVNATCNQ